MSSNGRAGRRGARRTSHPRRAGPAPRRRRCPARFGARHRERVGAAVGGPDLGVGEAASPAAERDRPRARAEVRDEGRGAGSPATGRAGRRGAPSRAASRARPAAVYSVSGRGMSTRGSTKQGEVEERPRAEHVLQRLAPARGVAPARGRGGSPASAVSCVGERCSGPVARSATSSRIQRASTVGARPAGVVSSARASSEERCPGRHASEPSCSARSAAASASVSSSSGSPPASTWSRAWTVTPTRWSVTRFSLKL